MRTVYFSFVFILLLIKLEAQELIPLQQNPVLRQQQEKNAKKTPVFRGLPKMDCPLEEAGVYYVNGGAVGLIDIPIDTSLAGEAGGFFRCDNCGDATFGSAVIAGKQVAYTATMGLTGKDFIMVSFCSNADPNTCYDQVILQIVARRNGQHFFPSPILLSAEEEAVATANPSLPGQLSCSLLVDCDDNYEGREQDIIPIDDTRIFYRASRFAGVDSVCLVLCDNYAVCDTYHFAFRIVGDTMSLPFMDDFSYEGPYPARSHWIDREAFVNNTMSQGPPSVGVATLDGLDQEGLPYGGGTGAADRLTSNYLDLKGNTSDLVLSYWVQARGLADKPEIGDSLLLQFKTKQGKWENIERIPGLLNSEPLTSTIPFAFYAVPIPEEYKYEGFQFRFSNIADRKGMNDVWHIDYVRLDGVQVDTFINDIAFTQLPSPILENYTSMPWRHFQGTPENELARNITVNLYNHANQGLLADPSFMTLRELTTTINPFFGALVLLNGQERNVLEKQASNRVYSLENDPVFPSVWSDYALIMEGPSFNNVNGPIRFKMSYTLSNSSQLNASGFESVQRNDAVSYTNVFDNYFSYDDGTAELALVSSPGTDVALKFTAGVADSLQAVAIHHPFTSSTNIEEQFFRLKIWIGELDNSPDYQALLNPFFATNNFDTLQGFTTYLLTNADGEPQALYLPAGDFYVGWEQASACDFNECVTIGYDRNRSQARNFTYRNAGVAWEPINLFIPGALMIRPIVGTEKPISTPVKEVEVQPLQVKIYPNPAQNELFVKIPEANFGDFEYNLFNHIGQSIKNGSLEPTIDLNGLINGTYLIQVRNPKTNQIYRERLIILK
ncbi:MAG: T9SS type A sorting domain-containing protein [Saprospiraceae bacterium]